MLLVGLAVLGAAGPALSQSAGPTPAELVTLLRPGGHVLFFRHARTDHSQEDAGLGDCRTERNLSEEGRAQARALGEAMRRLGIPVGRVLASPYCRTRETAELAFGRTEITTDLTGRGATPEGARLAIALLRPLLATLPAPGTNTVLVSHGFNLRAVDGTILLEGEAAIYRPAGDGTFRLVGRLTADQWDAP